MVVPCYGEGGAEVPGEADLDHHVHGVGLYSVGHDYCNNRPGHCEEGGGYDRVVGVGDGDGVVPCMCYDTTWYQENTCSFRNTSSVQQVRSSVQQGMDILEPGGVVAVYAVGHSHVPLQDSLVRHHLHPAGEGGGQEEGEEKEMQEEDTEDSHEESAA